MTLSTTMLDRDSIRELDATSIGNLMSIHADYRIVTEYATGQGYWRPGDGEPSILLDPPSAQAAGRCMASRVRGLSVPSLSIGSIHPARCHWCEAPVDVLLKALDHATWMSRYVAAEYIEWPTKTDPYVRSTGRAETYENPAWASFWSLSRDDRAYLIARSQAAA